MRICQWQYGRSGMPDGTQTLGDRTAGMGTAGTYGSPYDECSNYWRYRACPSNNQVLSGHGAISGTSFPYIRASKWSNKGLLEEPGCWAADVRYWNTGNGNLEYGNCKTCRFWLISQWKMPVGNPDMILAAWSCTNFYLRNVTFLLRVVSVCASVA